VPLTAAPGLDDVCREDVHEDLVERPMLRIVFEVIRLIVPVEGGGEPGADTGDDTEALHRGGLRKQVRLTTGGNYGKDVGTINAFRTGDYRKDLIVAATPWVYLQFII